jgi:hypothetical protein
MRRFVLLTMGIALAPAGIVCGQWWGWGDAPSWHASTAGEGYARGLADMMRSAGVNNLLNSQAAIYQEQAQSAALDNDVKYAQAYFDRRQIRDAYMADRRNRRSQTTEAAFRQEPAPAQRLTSAELDPVTGELFWPAGLSGPAFQQVEAQLGEVFAARAKSPASFGPEQSRQVRALIGELRQALRAQVNQIPSQQWVEAEGFLRRLDQEARFASS